MRPLPGIVPSPRDEIDRRLERERPRPDREFAQTTRRALTRRWALASRPPHLPWLVAAFIVGGAAVLILALVVALS